MPGGDLAARPGGRRRGLAGHPEQVVAFVGGEHQGPGQRGQHLARGVRAAGLLQPDVVVDRQAGQLGHFLTAQPRGAPPCRVRAGRPTWRGLQPGAAGAQEGRQLGAVDHGPSVPQLWLSRGPPAGGTAGPRHGRSLPPRRRPLLASMAMTTTIALITGANKGIGLETARQLGARGVTVLAGARDPARGVTAERALRAGGAEARFVALDVTDEESVRAAADMDRAGVRPAGHPGQQRGHRPAAGRPARRTSTLMREVYETNVFGVITVTNAMLPLLRRAPAARIVNVSSEVGSITSMTDPASPLARMPASLAYPSSKTALNMITAMYAKELRDTPIKVNAANPGYTEDRSEPQQRVPLGGRGRRGQRVPGHAARRRPERHAVGSSVDRRWARRRLRRAALVTTGLAAVGGRPGVTGLRVTGRRGSRPADGRSVRSRFGSTRAGSAAARRAACGRCRRSSARSRAGARRRRPRRAGPGRPRCWRGRRCRRRAGPSGPGRTRRRSPSTTVALAHSRSSGVEVATYFATPLMNVANGSISLPGQNSAHSS